MKDKNIEKENNSQEEKKRYSKGSAFQNGLYINGYSNYDNQEFNNIELHSPNAGIPVSKEIIEYLNFSENEVQDNDKNYCVKQQNKLNKNNDEMQDVYKTSQSLEDNEPNVCNKSLNTDYSEYTSKVVKESFGVSLSLKDKLFEDFLVQKEDIEKGKYIPKFEEFHNIPKYEGLTKKHFNHIRNEWFKEILHKHSFIEYRNEIMTKVFFENDKNLLKLIKTNQYPEGALVYNLIKLLNLSFSKLERSLYGENSDRILKILKKRGSFNWEGMESKIRQFIISIKDNSLRRAAIIEFQNYLSSTIYFGFMSKDFPDIENFNVEIYPEGWLILNICEINLISDKKMGKLIGYDDLPYHLSLFRGFKGKRIEKIKEFINNIDNENSNIQTVEILSKYIGYIVLNQIKDDNSLKLKDYLRKNPKKWLVIKLCEVYLVLLRDLGRLIEYEEISKVINREYDFSDTIVDRIHNFIANQDQKEQADNVLSQYLKRSIYNKFKTGDYPEYEDFKTKINPALWLVIQICSIYQIRINQLGKFIDSNELFKRLRDISYFTNQTIIKFRKFITQYGIYEQKLKARKAIDRFLQVRDSKFLRYFSPQIANLDKLSKFPQLLNHLKLVNKLGNFPDDILENYHEYPRISSFNKQFRHIDPIYKKKFISKMISNGIIKVINAKNCEEYRNIYNLIELSKNKYYYLSHIYPSHNSPGHEYVLPKILIENQNSVGIEIPVWMRHENLFLTGHIDLIHVNDGTIYIADYKPEETPYITSRLSYSFMRSLPQVASYGLLLKRVFGIKDLLCITFNKKGAWVYEPEISLKLYNSFIKKFKKYKAHDRPWEKYFLKPT